MNSLIGPEVTNQRTGPHMTTFSQIGRQDLIKNKNKTKLLLTFSAGRMYEVNVQEVAREPSVLCVPKPKNFFFCLCSTSAVPLPHVEHGVR